MDLTQNLGDRNRLTRTLLAVGLAVFALWSLRKGKRLRGALAGLGAVALGYGASTESDGTMEHLAEIPDTDPTSEAEQQPTSEAEQLRCAICGEPIVPGQPRTPNENDETVHEACLEAPA